jgi:hypothetical protein
MSIEQGWNANKKGKTKTLGEKRVPVPLKIKGRISEKVRVAESQESSSLVAKFEFRYRVL